MQPPKIIVNNRQCVLEALNMLALFAEHKRLPKLFDFIYYVDSHKYNLALQQ